MPDPLLYLKAMAAAAVACSTIMLASFKLSTFMPARFLPAKSESQTTTGATWRNSTCVLGIGWGLVAGYFVLSLQLAWPPRNGLDRLLTIVLPVVLCIELIAAITCVPRWVAWLLRLSLSVAIPGILLHGSVFLSGSGSGWTIGQQVAILAACSLLLVVLWSLLSWLSQRSPGVSIPFALQISILCTGLTVMMAGYIKGGAAAFPLISTLLAASVVAWLVAKRANASTICGSPAIIGVGVVGLFGLLFIGRFFGELSTGDALVMLLAPLLCWITEIPLLRNRKPWVVGSLRLILVAIPLLVVLFMAKRDFDREMAPLLVQGPRYTIKKFA